MVQHKSVLNVADNSGAQKVMVISPLGGSGKKKARLAEICSGVVKKATPHGQVKDGEVVRFVIVRTRKEVRRADGSYIKFDDNAAVIIDKDGNMRATRVFGPVAREVRDAGYSKIVSLAPEVW